MREKSGKRRREMECVKGAREKWYKWNFLMRWIRIRCVLPAAVAAKSATTAHTMIAWHREKWENYMYEIRTHFRLRVCTLVLEMFWKPSLQKAQRCAANHVHSLQPHFCFFSFMRCLVAQLLACSLIRSFALPQKNTLINPHTKLTHSVRIY